ncbi:cellulose binding domain-containing protein [Microbispora sp. NBRC 16548]|uniref:cellulose binding domain-containing protein n=1 Tax=Microbispora sp. NBRC 16548 TaxID=3030994 RepID=UPI0025564138|nr:cellulose binding domain-containing protein [Microbispora sp. NBRC 16548]
MRSKTGMGAWVTAVLLAVAALVVPAAARTEAGAAVVALTTAPPPPTPIPCEPGTPSAGTPPTAPGTPEIVHVLLNAVSLRWAPATDEDGIACYRVQETRDGVTSVKATFGPNATGGDLTLRWPPSGVAFEDHELHVVAVDTEGAVSPASGSVTVRIYNDVITTPSPSPRPITCRVTYRSFGFNGTMSSNISITNTGAAPVHDWRLTFLFTDSGQMVLSGWSATWSQTGSEVTAAAPSWGSDIAPGQTVYIGFNGYYSGVNSNPVQWRLNGAPCTPA